MENLPDGAAPLVAAPRHLRRRRLHGEIPDALLVPEAESYILPSPDARTAPPSAAARKTESIASHRRKRRVAVTLVVLVSVCLAGLVLLLLLLGR